ncbi:hypothetical protein QOZ80_2AG0129070 [Eleusine coracana subsp. coracana]|nr:hypothetical protein QOZ80_2AG0129070 [Eleusine coracana subsp. coracana]
MRGAKPPRVDPNATTGGETTEVESGRSQPRPCCCCVFKLALLCAAAGLLAHLVRTDPIDAVSATGLDAPGPSFDVAVRVRMRWFHLAPRAYRHGTVGVSWAGSAVTASGPLQDVYLDPVDSGVANATARAAAALLPPDARQQLEGELRLDVAVAYEKDVGTPLGRGFRAWCAAVPLGRGNSTASCNVVKQ